MSWFGTDVVALGCILGGAAVGGAATLAVLDGADHHVNRCAVEAVAVAPSVAISHNGGARAIVIRPDVRVRSDRDCAREIRHVVRVRGDHSLEFLEADMEQLEANLEQMETALEVQLEGLESQIETQLEAQLEANLHQEFEAQLHFEEAMRKLKEAQVRIHVSGVGEGGS
jgi:hypothetical protein